VRVRAADAASCFGDLAGMPSTDTLPDWRFIQTAAFKIWYPLVVSGRNAQMGLYSADDAYAAAINVAATIQADFDRLRAVLGDPMRDADQACNGGDARIDVYVTRVGLSAKAQVMSYLPGQCARPGWMWIAPDAIPDPRTARNIVAHELVHLFQLRVARSHCDDFRYSGFDEMHASWAFDHLYPRDNFEHRFALGNDGYFSGEHGEWNATPLLANPFWGITNCNGYCDYVFFEWLDRKFGPTGLRAVLDAGASANPARSFETGLAGVGGGLERLWPQFALAMWNDYEDHVQDAFHQWERLGGASLKMSFSKAENHFLTADLNGASKREMGQAIVNLVQGSLDPMTMDYLHIKFSDPQVSRIKLEHRAAVLHGAHSRVRVQALQKIDGQWQAAEDWSGENEKIFCRDKKAERIEELVLVYSNSYSGDAAFDGNPPSSVQLFDQDAKLPKLTLSNASCMPWHGTSKVTQTNSYGGVLRATAANVEFKLPSSVDPDEMEELPLKFFVPASGLATVEGDWVDASGSGCHQLTQRVQGAIGELDGQLYINLDTRVVTGYGLTTIPGSVHTLSCPGTDPIATPGPANSQWLSMPVLGTSLGDDGRTIDGSYDTLDPITGVRTQSEWHFSAQREE
jgi:hypothetical protein